MKMASCTLPTAERTPLECDERFSKLTCLLLNCVFLPQFIFLWGEIRLT